ncbi:hypothetical protein GCM10022381_31670 [Leifsonia kafniensis]|uniref:DUF2975 domain-containing protein n=1 Tax=Leifsonia kafniensis TaxID=475957 RepID=A0ABP7KT30_9MICO
MKTRTKSRITRLERAFERYLTWVVLFGALATGVIATVTGARGLISNVSSDTTPLTLLTDAALPPEASGGTAQIVDGAFETAFVTLSHLTPLTTFLIALGTVVGIVTTLIVSTAIALLCWKLLKRRPFDRSVSWMAYAVGSVLLIGTILGQGFGGLGRMMAASELNPDGLDGFWPLTTPLDLAPAFVGIALLMVATAFEAGRRLQRDTEGLV